MKTGFGTNGFSGNFIALLGLACVFSMNLACAQQATTNTDMRAPTNQAQVVHFAIIDANSGQDLTLQTNTVIVGQQMNMYAQLSAISFFVAQVSLNAAVAVKHKTIYWINGQNLIWIAFVHVRSCPQLVADVICRQA